jgi:hypothetical protein
MVVIIIIIVIIEENEEEAMDIEDAERKVSHRREIEMLKVVLYLVSRNIG